MTGTSPDRLEQWIVAGLRWSLLIALGIALELLIVAGVVNEFVMPKPSSVLKAAYDLIVGFDIFVYFGITLGEVLVVTLGLILIGIPFGILIASKKLLWRSWSNWVAGLSAAPIVLLYPLFLVVFGRGWLTVVMIALVTALPPVVLKAAEGVQNVRQTLLNVGRSFNMTTWQRFRIIVFPSALPVILLGMRLGLIYALITVVAVEYLISLGGLGRLVAEFSERYELAPTYATVLMVIVLSSIFFIAIEWAEKWLTRTV